ncbi:MAG: hypothetical protein QMD36_06645 [Candidatus Aenigmarchaeota archaeon]|nr:hypothetical protein [Candidatus Aenigmarchaeota archaeon]
MKEAIRVQEKIIPKIETTRKLVKFGHSIAVILPKELHAVFKKEVKAIFNTILYYLYTIPLKNKKRGIRGFKEV